MKSGDYRRRGNASLVSILPGRGAAQFPVIFRPLPRSQKPRPLIITASRSSFSKGLEFLSLSVSLIPSKLLAVSVFPRHIPGYTAEHFLEMLLRVTEHVAWLVWSGCDFPDPSCPGAFFFFLCSTRCSEQHLFPDDVYQALMDSWKQPVLVLLFWKSPVSSTLLSIHD